MDRGIGRRGDRRTDRAGAIIAFGNCTTAAACAALALMSLTRACGAVSLSVPVSISVSASDWLAACVFALCVVNCTRMCHRTTAAATRHEMTIDFVLR